MQKPKKGDKPNYLTVLYDEQCVGLVTGESVITTIYKDEVYRCSYDRGDSSVDVILELPSGKRVFAYFYRRFRLSYKNEVKLCKY